MAFIPLWIFFGDCLPGVEFPAETQGLLVQPEIRLDKREMHLELQSEAWVEPAVIAGLCRGVAEATNCRVTHSIRYVPQCFDEPAWHWLLQKLREAVVVVNGFLHTTEIVWQPPELLLRTSETGKKVLEEAGAAGWIQKFVRTHFDLRAEVRIVAGEERSFDPAKPLAEPTPVIESAKPLIESLIIAEPIKPLTPSPSHLTDIAAFTAGGKALYGGGVKEKPAAMSSLEAGGAAAIIGEVFGLKEAKTKSGKKIIAFNLTDDTDCVPCKLIAGAETCDALLESLQNGACALVGGVFEYDKFSKANCLRVKSASSARRALPEDDAPEKRVELHLHTNMSEMDGLADIDALAARAAAWGHRALAVTDHGVAQAFPAAMEAGSKHGVKILYGMEAYYVDDSPEAVLDAAGPAPFDQAIVVFDLETTGLRPRKDRVIEIGAVKIQKGEIVEDFQCFVDPGRPLPTKITQLTHIEEKDLAGAPDEFTAARKFADFCGDALLAAHNAKFDTGFLRALYRRHGGEFSRPCVDTMALAQMLLPEMRNYRLNTLAEHFRVGAFEHHRADCDARVTGRVLLELMALARKNHPACASDFSWFNEGHLLIDPKKAKFYHMILLTKNQAGLKNLYKLITKSHLEHHQRRPRVPKSELIKHREGLLAGSACEAGELYQALLRGESDEKLRQIASFYDYLEIQPGGNNAFLLRPSKEDEPPELDSEEELLALNRRIVELARSVEKPAVATGDVHFLDAKDAACREILQSAQGYEDSASQAPLYYRTTRDMLAQFACLGEETAYEVVVKNPNLIADQIEELRPFPRGTYPPSIEGSDQALRESCYAYVNARYGEPLPDTVARRLEKELDAIIRHDFAVMYVIAQKLVRHSEAHGYYVGSRGSVGSSFAAYAAGISEVNPLAPHYLCAGCRYSEFYTDGSVGSGFDLPPKDCPRCGAPLQRDGHDIPFETFLGFEGDKQPDIDLNFSGEYQFQVHRYTEELFGKSHVFKAGTIGTLAEKSAAFFVKKYLEKTGREMTQAEIDRLAHGCEGVKRTTGQHPGGMVIIPADMEAEDFTPVQYPANDETKGMTTHFDFHSLHDTILKMDNLGHDVPTLYKYLERLTGVPIGQADLCDPNLYQLFLSPEPLGVTAAEIGCPTGTLSLPEMGTPFVLGMLVDTRPKCFSDLLQVSGLSHGENVWLGNAQELIKDGTCTISEVIGTRDNIMLALMRKGLPPKQAFQITEAVRKPHTRPTQEHIGIMLDYGVEDWYIDSCKKIRYMFPKAHAAAYVIAALRLAWYKIYYPLEYYAAYLTVRGEDLDTRAVLAGRGAVQARLREVEARFKRRETTQKEEDLIPMLQVVNEMLARGIQVLPVDIYLSEAAAYTIENGKIRLPFAALEGCGEKAARQMAEARNDGGGEYFSKDEFKRRTGAPAPVMALLEELGAFEGMSRSDQMSLFEI